MSEELSDLRALDRALPLIIIVIGLSLVSVNIVAGYMQWHFLLTLVVGALIHSSFRVFKRMFKNTLAQSINEAQQQANQASSHQSQSQQQSKQPEENDISPSRVKAKAKVANMGSNQLFMLVYGAMLLVTGFWYGIGRLIGWLLG